jgi:hypothetical protein
MSHRLLLPLLLSLSTLAHAQEGSEPDISRQAPPMP